MSDAYDFLSELLKLTEYGDISNSSFTARWIKTNKSLMSYNCMSYFRRYISDQNYVTESEFQKYQMKVKSVGKDIHQNRNDYFEENVEPFVRYDDDIILNHLEIKIKWAENYLEYIKLSEANACKKLSSIDSELVQLTRCKKLSDPLSDVNEFNKLHDQLTINLIAYLNELTDFVTRTDCDELDIDENEVECINSYVFQNIQLFLKKHFSEITGREESKCNTIVHKKLSDRGLDLSHLLKCKNRICVPLQILELKELHNRTADLEYGKHLLHCKRGETTLCLEEIKKFIENTEEDSFLPIASEMRSMTRDNDEKIAILKNITKEFYEYVNHHVRGDDFFIEVLKDKLKFTEKELKFYVTVLQKLADVSFQHSALNKSVLFLVSLKFDKIQSAARLCSRAGNFLTELYSDHYVRMSTIRNIVEHYDFAKKTRFSKLRKLTDEWRLKISVNDESSIVSALSNAESEINQSVFSVIPTERLKELNLVKYYRERLHKILFNGPMMQPVGLGSAVTRQKGNIKSELESQMGQLSIIQSELKDNSEDPSDISWVISSSLWAIFLANPDKMKELFDNMDKFVAG